MDSDLCPWPTRPDGEAVRYEEFRGLLNIVSVAPCLMLMSPSEEVFQSLDQLRADNPSVYSLHEIVAILICKAFDISSAEEAVRYYTSIEVLDTSGYIHSMAMNFSYGLSWEQGYLQIALRELYDLEDKDGLRIILGLMARASGECAARKSAVFSAIINRVAERKPKSAQSSDSSGSRVESVLLKGLDPILAEKCREDPQLLQSCQRVFDMCLSHIVDMKDKAFDSTFIQPTLFYAALVGDELLATDADVHGGPTYLAFLQATLGIKISRLCHLTDEAKGVTDVLNAGLGDVVSELWRDENMGKSWTSVPACKQLMRTSSSSSSSSSTDNHHHYEHILRRNVRIQPRNQFIFPNRGSYGGGVKSVKEYADLAVQYDQDDHNNYYPPPPPSPQRLTVGGFLGMFASSFVGDNVSNSQVHSQMRTRLAEYLRQFCKYFREENVLPRLFNAVYTGTMVSGGIAAAENDRMGNNDDLQKVFLALKQIDNSRSSSAKGGEEGGGGVLQKEGEITTTNDRDQHTCDDDRKSSDGDESITRAITPLTSAAASAVTSSSLSTSSSSTADRKHFSSPAGEDDRNDDANDTNDSDNIPSDCNDVRYWLWNFDEFPAVMNLARARRLFSALGVVKPKGWTLTPAAASSYKDGDVGNESKATTTSGTCTKKTVTSGEQETSFSSSSSSSSSRSRRDPLLPKDSITLTAAGCVRGGGTGREFLQNLLNDGTENWNKWLHPGYVTSSWVCAQFTTPDSSVSKGGREEREGGGEEEGGGGGYLLTEYGLCSANDCPHRDPSSWILYGTTLATSAAGSGSGSSAAAEDDQRRGAEEVILHSVSSRGSSGGPIFTARWQWHWYTIPDPRVVTSVRLVITGVQRPGDCLQLGHFHLRGRLTSSLSLLPPPPPLSDMRRGLSDTGTTIDRGDREERVPCIPPSAIRLTAAGAANGGGTRREFLSNLLLDGNEAWNKWVHPGRVSSSWIRADFTNSSSSARGYIVTEYGLCSANDCPHRDPTEWTLRGQVAGSGE